MSDDSSSSANNANLSDLGRALLGTNEGSKPSGPWVPPTAEELHAILPQYEIVKMLGRGGMGAVYMGTQTALERPVAIKILSSALEDSDAGFTERFKNEAKAMAKLNHPGIVSVYEFGETATGLLYIVMEYVDGTDVAKMIAAKGRVHTEHAMAITAHVCDALAYAHERGIIHRDIKPANIMVGYDGNVKVADFGLAKVNAGGKTLGLTMSGMAMGTLHFMAPEALMLGTAVDHRADIYAVGVMLYQMLTGKLPQGMFKMPSLSVPGLDPRYDTIIAKAMMEDREARYQSARKMRSELDGIVTQPVARMVQPEQPPVTASPTVAQPRKDGGGQPYRPPQMPARPQTPAKSAGGRMTTVLAVLLLGIGGWWVFTQPGEKLLETSVPTAIPAPAVSPAPASTPTTPSSAGNQPDKRIPPPDDSKRAPVAMAVPPPAPSVIPASTSSTPSVPQPTFTNSMGMQFIEVPATKVLFCIHETRRKDYATYAAAVPGVNKEWQNPVHEGVSLTAGEDHPVLNVSWEDARAFCTWLGQKEGRKYRMPTDREWSIAAGLGEFEPPDIKPEDAMTQPTKGVYPWGTTWPPPAASGNFADESFAKAFPGSKFIRGYNDGFSTTSPVMSFKPNPVGLYDMAGNVFEFCEEPAGWTNNKRGRRSSSFDDYYEYTLASARRGQTYPSSRYALTGFRCVLESAPATTTSAPTSMPAQPAGSIATATTWVDAKNRTLNAKFVQVQGMDVILLVNGRNTPVPLASLSIASQKMAGELAQQQSAAAIQWLFGVWAVLDQGQAALYDPCAFFSDGSAVRSLPTSRFQPGSWQMEGEMLKVSWEDQTRWDLPVPDLRRPSNFGGQASQGTEPARSILLAHRGAAAAMRPKAPEAAELGGKTFALSWRATGQGATHGEIRLEKDGRISFSISENEHAWELRDGFLIFRNIKGQPTSVFDEFEKIRGRWKLSGSFLGVRNVQHILEQK